jgi:PhnB protein
MLEAVITSFTVHLTVGDGLRAASWYPDALGAVEMSRITLPGGKLIHLEMRFGDAGTVMFADEFPELGSLSPASLGGTYGALYLPR